MNSNNTVSKSHQLGYLAIAIIVKIVDELQKEIGEDFKLELGNGQLELPMEITVSRGSIARRQLIYDINSDGDLVVTFSAHSGEKAPETYVLPDWAECSTGSLAAWLKDTTKNILTQLFSNRTMVQCALRVVFNQDITELFETGLRDGLPNDKLAKDIPSEIYETMVTRAITGTQESYKVETPLAPQPNATFTITLIKPTPSKYRNAERVHNAIMALLEEGNEIVIRSKAGEESLLTIKYED